MKTVKETINLMFNQMREAVKSPNTGPKVKVSDDANNINQTIDVMERDSLRHAEASKNDPMKKR